MIGPYHRWLPLTLLLCGGLCLGLSGVFSFSVDRTAFEVLARETYPDANAYHATAPELWGVTRHGFNYGLTLLCLGLLSLGLTRREHWDIPLLASATQLRLWAVWTLLVSLAGVSVDALMPLLWGTGAPWLERSLMPLFAGLGILTLILGCWLLAHLILFTPNPFFPTSLRALHPRREHLWPLVAAALFGLLLALAALAGRYAAVPALGCWGVLYLNLIPRPPVEAPAGGIAHGGLEGS